jgi:adenylate cyclase
MHKEIILAVDDLPENLMIIKMGLRKHNYEVITASSGDEALRILEHTTPDLILMDIQMPGLDGFETTAQIKQNPRLRDIPLLFISALKDLSNIIRCFEAGAVDYVSKPFRNPELIARISTHLKIRQLQKTLEQEHQKMNAILENVLPGKYVVELKNGVRPRTEMHENVVVLFTDFQNFTGISRDLGPEKSILHLNEIFFAFDEIITAFGLERVKTIGDGYFAIAGINTTTENAPIRVIAALLKMHEFVRLYNERHPEVVWKLRVGAHIGNIIAGIVGYQKIAFDVWGHPVNIASRLQSVADSSGVCISEELFEIVKNDVVTNDPQMRHLHHLGDSLVYTVTALTQNAPAHVRELYSHLSAASISDNWQNGDDLLNKLFPKNTAD